MKTVVITGASRGVGLTTAIRFLNRGWQVIGLSRSHANLDDDYDHISTDLRRYDSIQNAFHYIQQHYDTIDLLINNAAVFKSTSLLNHSQSDIYDIITTNLLGTIFCTQLAIPLLRKNTSRIINVASVSGMHGIENQTIYCASKFGIAGFAEALELELQKEGILISTIYPGGIDTPLWNKNNPYPGDVNDLISSEDVADVIEFIADLSPHIVMKKIVMFPTNESH